MSQTKRTALYSAAVLTLGLGAIIGIYSNTANNNIADIAPAAGEAVTEAAVEQTHYSSDIPATDIMEAIPAELQETADDVLAEIEDIMNAVAAEETAMDDAATMIEAIAPAAGDDHGDDHEEEEEISDSDEFH